MATTSYLKKGDFILSYTTSTHKPNNVVVARRAGDVPSPQDPDCYILNMDVKKARASYRKHWEEGYHPFTPVAA